MPSDRDHSKDAQTEEEKKPTDWEEIEVTGEAPGTVPLETLRERSDMDSRSSLAFCNC